LQAGAAVELGVAPRHDQPDIVCQDEPDKNSGALLALARGPAHRMTQLSEIYNKRILELSADIARAERLGDADGTATAHSKLCGSTVTVDLKLGDDRVTAFGQTVKACLLGQAAASVMGRNIVGTSAGELREVGSAMRRMLKEGGPPPSGRWADLAVLEPVKDYKARHASTLLVFDAVEMALAKAEAKEVEPVGAQA
jgi:NifU-like protein involved in Fe-S cluster formation